MNREIFTSIDAEKLDAGLLKVAARVRLQFILPTIFGLTFLFFLRQHGHGHHLEAQQAAFLLWVTLTVSYFIVNLAISKDLFSRELLNKIAIIPVFIELATNQLLLYYVGTMASHAVLYVVVIVAAYRVFLDYRTAFYAALMGVLLFTGTAFMELAGLIPISPGLVFELMHPVYSDYFAATALLIGVIIGIGTAFFSTNYGMNQAYKLKQTILQQSLSDGLTGIANRRHFEKQLEVEWNRALRNQRPVSLILADVDCFKNYNDNYGHLAGDDCLKAVAGKLASAVNRSSDLVARYGGEEFVFLLPELSLQKAVELAEIIRYQIENLAMSHQYSAAADIVTISLGVASAVPQKNANSAALIRDADRALYYAKQNGRNQVATFDQ